MLENRLRFAVLNSSYNDQHLFVTLVQSARTLLFDTGPMEVPKALAHEVRDVCISHRHMDHLEGFPSFARQVLATREPVRVYGPKGIARALSGMLQAFEWNYAQRLRLRLDVHEVVDEATLVRTELNIRRGFRMGRSEQATRTPVVHQDRDVALTAFDLAHHTVPCLGYRLALPDEWRVDSKALLQLGVKPGPWLGELLERLARGEEPGAEETVPPPAKQRRGKSKQAEEQETTATEAPTVKLKQVAAEAIRKERGIRLGYVTDTGDTPAVRERLREHLAEADVLFCEAYFAHAEAKRAAQNGHLTAVQAGEIAQELNVGELVVTHISPRYPPGRILNEVRKVFARTRSKRDFLLTPEEYAEANARPGDDAEEF